mmetsp:Transcript_104972/g.163649  ORF Transcript_104972/g.163649 Transcript_104972/m.163649 type:complete len:80 (-) Transcript_104972:21-260(-)
MPDAFPTHLWKWLRHGTKSQQHRTQFDTNVSDIEPLFPQVHTEGSSAKQLRNFVFGELQPASTAAGSLPSNSQKLKFRY